MVEPVFKYSSANITRCRAYPSHFDLSLRMVLPYTPDRPPIVSDLDACYSRTVCSHSGTSPFLLRPGMQILRVTHQHIQHIYFCIPPAFSLNRPSSKHVPTVAPILVSARCPRKIPPSYP